MPAPFFCPEPALFAEGEDQIEHVGMAFAFDDLLFDVEDEGASGLEDALELGSGGEKPVHVLVGGRPLIDFLSGVGVGW